MNSEEKIAEIRIPFEIPVPRAGVCPPVTLERSFCVKREGEAPTIHFIVRRNTDAPIRNFTLRFRYSDLPIDVDDERRPFYEAVFGGEKIGNKEFSELRARLAPNKKVTSFSAYISSVLMENGEKLSFDVSDFEYGNESEEKPDTRLARVSENAEDGNEEERYSFGTTIPADNKADNKSEDISRRQGRGKKRRNRIIAAVLCADIVICILCGAAIARHIGIGNTVQRLLSEGRYNEAYKIASDAHESGILQNICELVSAKYLDEGDFISAYTYAAAAPKPFGENVAFKAAEAVFDTENGKIRENAFAAAQKLNDIDNYDTLMSSLIGFASDSRNYDTAMQAAKSIKNDDRRNQSVSSVLMEAVRYYTSNQQYSKAVRYIENYGDTLEMNDMLTEKLIDYCVSVNDSGSAVYFADYFGKDTSGIVVQPDDVSIKSAIDIVYPMLTAEQKRAYHSQPLAIYKEIFRIDDGKIEGTDVTDAVSVVSREYNTIVLHSDGSVTVLADGKSSALDAAPDTGDIVQVAVGEHHFVFLHADGTVTATGENENGQCDVDDWKDVVCVAAGENFTIGLKSDGTLYGCGSDACGQTDLSGYRNVIDIDACNQSSVLLFSNGDVRVQGERSLGLGEADSFKDVVRICAGDSCVLAQKNDGTFVIASGSVGGSYGSPESWKNIKWFAAGSVCIAAVDNMGKLYTSGDNVPVK